MSRDISKQEALEEFICPEGISEPRWKAIQTHLQKNKKNYFDEIEAKEEIKNEEYSKLMESLGVIIE